MRPRRFCGCEDRFRRGVGIETGNIVGDRSGEQFNVLRQIADGPAESVLRPLGRRRAIVSHLASQGTPDAGQPFRDRRLPGAGWSDQADRLSGLKREGDAADDRIARARRGQRQIDDLERLRGRGVRGRLRGVRPLQVDHQPGEGLPRLNRSLQMRDSQLDRG